MSIVCSKNEIFSRKSLNAPDDKGISLPQFFRKHIRVVMANTPERQHEFFKLRKMVYVDDRGWEKPNDEGIETDSADKHSDFALAYVRGVDEPFAGVRLVFRFDKDNRRPHLPADIPLTDEFIMKDEMPMPEDFPLYDFLSTETAEISRFCISKERRKAIMEGVESAMWSGKDVNMLNRCMSLTPMRMSLEIAAKAGVHNFCAAMQLGLLKILDGAGVKFNRLTPTIEYHGKRAICFRSIIDMLSDLKELHPEHFDIISNGGKLVAELLKNQQEKNVSAFKGYATQRATRTYIAGLWRQNGDRGLALSY